MSAATPMVQTGRWFNFQADQKFTCFFFRKSLTASIVRSLFLSLCPLSSNPSIRFGRHTSHLKDSGLVFTKVWHSLCHDKHIFNSRVALYNVGLGKNDRYLISLTVTHPLDCHVTELQNKPNHKDSSLKTKLLLLWFSYPRVVEASIEGQSTFGMEDTEGGSLEKKKKTKMEKLQIVEAALALRWRQNMSFCENICLARILLHLNGQNVALG